MDPRKMTRKQLIAELNARSERVRELENRAGTYPRLDLLAETASQLLRSDSPRNVVDALCHKVHAFLDCQTFFNYLVDDEKKRLHLNAFGGISDEDAQKMEWLALDLVHDLHVSRQARADFRHKLIPEGYVQDAKFTQGLLSFSRQQVMNRVPVAVNDVVTGTVKLLRKMFPRDIHFSPDLSSEMPTVMADSGQLSQVFMNLAINARDAMTAGGVLSITTRTTVLDAETAQSNGLGRRAITWLYRLRTTARALMRRR